MTMAFAEDVLQHISAKRALCSLPSIYQVENKGISVPKIAPYQTAGVEFLYLHLAGNLSTSPHTQKGTISIY
jgi:hypothetical protein